jgi:hypothetical protein
MFNTALRVTDRAISTRERGRSRFPLREPIGPRPHGPVGRTLWEREGNDPAASLCLRATDYACSPAHWYLCLRFKRHLAIPPARLEARMDSLLSFPVGLFHPLQHAGFDPGAPKLDVAGSIPVSRFTYEGGDAYEK